MSEYALMHKVLVGCESTQSELKQIYARDSKLSSLSFVHSFHQTGGKGRQGRQWQSNAGGLYLSVFLRGPHTNLTWIPHWAALKTARALIKVGVPEERVRIKWPNDVMIDGKSKIAGIICEQVDQHVVIGIGLNVWNEIDLDRDTARIIDLVSNTDNKRNLIERVRNLVLSEFNESFNLSETKENYLKFSVFETNQEIRWTDVGSEEVRSGRFLHFGEFGEMKVQVNDQVIPLYSGDVHLKPSKAKDPAPVLNG